LGNSLLASKGSNMAILRKRPCRRSVADLNGWFR
jgi:hypothetical protein